MHTPVRGVIDVVLVRQRPAQIIAVEAESGLRRIEQQVRWATAKADALAVARGDADGPAPVSRLLLLRSTIATRAVAATYRDILSVAYPARMVDALAALTGTDPWPGAAIIWCHSVGSSARLLDSPPRGIDLGR